MLIVTWQNEIISHGLQIGKDQTADTELAWWQKFPIQQRRVHRRYHNPCWHTRGPGHGKAFKRCAGIYGRGGGGCSREARSRVPPRTPLLSGSSLVQLLRFILCPENTQFLGGVFGLDWGMYRRWRRTKTGDALVCVFVCKPPHG